MNQLLCHTFEHLSREVWRDMVYCHGRNLSLGEESITERLLLELDRNFQHQVFIYSFNKQREEPIFGADWEWHLGGNNSWHSMRVQAKRIKLSNDKFTGFHTYKSGKPKRKQIDKLIAQASNDGLDPVYAMYLAKLNPNSTHKNIHWHHGIYMGDAVSLKRKRTDKLDKIAPVLFPWECLVCPCFSQKNSLNLAERSSQALASFSAREYADDSEFVGVQDSLPGPLLDYISSQAEQPDLSLWEYGDSRELGGVVVLHEGPLRRLR